MTETTPAASGTVPVESFPEFDAPDFAPPARSHALNADVPAPTAAASTEPNAATVGEPEAPKGETPATTPPAGTEPVKEEAAIEAAEPEPGPFSFAGRTFKDSAAAEHYLKTMEGRAKAEAKRVGEVEKRAVDAETRSTEAIRAANYYKAEAEKKAQTPETKPVETPAAKKPWIEDPKMWADVRKLADEEGVDAAVYHALQQANGHMSKEFDAKLEAATAPFKQKQESEKALDYARDLFEAAAVFAEPETGNPVYPELRNEADFASVLAIWRTFDPDFAMTERGLDYAVLRHREEHRQKGPKAPAPSGAPAKTAETLAAAANPAPEPLNGGGVPRATNGETDVRARFKRDLIGVGAPVLTPSGQSLGFLD